MSELADRMTADLTRIRGKRGNPDAARRRLGAIGSAYLKFAQEEPGLFATAFAVPRRHSYADRDGATDASIRSTRWDWRFVALPPGAPFGVAGKPPLDRQVVTCLLCREWPDVFHALAAPARRAILDELTDRDGQTLFELCARLTAKHGLGMSRQAVSQHLDVLEAGRPGQDAQGRPLQVPSPRHTPLDEIVRRWKGAAA